MKAYRCADGWVWEEQPDGSLRSYDEKGGYYQEPSLKSLELWSGPLTEVARCQGCGSPSDEGAHGPNQGYGGCT